MILQVNPTKPMDISETLTDEERRELKANEEAVRKGARAWLETGLALSQIFDKRLYRESHSSFEEYCEETLHVSRSLGYRLIAGAKRFPACVANWRQTWNFVYGRAQQIRPLVRCRAVDLPKVLKAVVAKTEPDAQGKRIPTAKILTEAVQAIGGRAPSPRPNGTANITSKESRKAVAGEVAIVLADPADTVKALRDWPDSDLLKVAQAIGGELVKRGLIGAPAGHAKPSAKVKNGTSRRAAESLEGVKYF